MTNIRFLKWFTGSIILVGDHIFTYISHESVTSNDCTETLENIDNSGAPPPKPLRHQRASELKQDILRKSQQNLLAAFDQSETMTSLATVDITFEDESASITFILLSQSLVSMCVFSICKINPFLNGHGAVHFVHSRRHSLSFMTRAT